MNAPKFEDYLKEDNLKMYVAIGRVRKLHKPEHNYIPGCGDSGCCGPTVDEIRCAECWVEYPCDTIKALDGEEDEHTK